ncbi:MAG: tetratricopeptide repeat protein, partial [Parvularculaceae bacterium]
TTKASAGFIGHDDFAGNGLDDLRSIVWFGARPEGRCVLSPLPNPKGVWSFAPKCDDADFKLAVTLLRRRGTAQSLADLAATRAAAEADRSLSQAEKRRRLKRADTIKSLIENLDAAFNPPSLRTRYAAAAVPAVRLSAVFGEAKPAHADGDALEIRHGDGRLDAPDTNEWAQYLASFTQGSSGASGNDAFIHDSAVLNGLQSSDVGATIEEGAFRDGRPPLIEIQASGGDAAAREWERVNAEVVRLHQAGDYAAATVKAEEALRLAEKAFGPDHPSTLASAYNLAGLYQTQRRFAESEALYLRSLNGVERVLGRDHPVTLSLVRSLAVLYHIQARYDEAERLYRRALDAWERTLGPNSFDTLVAAGNLAVLLQAKGDYDEAETLFVRSMKGLESSLGRDHRATLTAASNLGGFYHARGRYDDAEPLKRRAFEGRERIFGPDNQETLIAANNLALLYRDQGRFEEAEALLLRSFNRLEATLGPDNGSTLIAASNLASLYHVRRRYAEAEKLYRRAFEGSERAYGADHPATLTGASNLAGIFMDQGRYAEAEPLYRRAYEGSARTLGPTHQSTLLGLNNLAALFQKQGRNAEAEPLLLRALDGFLNIHGADHPLSFVTISSLAGLYRAQGLYEKAEPYYLTLLEGRERVLGAKDPSTLNTIKNYFIWRENASSARLASQWAGDARAMRLLETSLADFSGYLSAGADVARLDDPTSVESRSVELLTAFERARLAGVPGSDSAAAVFAAGAIAQRFQLSSVAAALELSSRRLADPAHRALLDRRIKLAREIEGRFKALNAMRGRGNRNAAAEATIEAEIDSLALEARNVASALAAGNEGQAEIDGAVIEGDLAGFASALDPDEAVILYSSAGEHYLAFVVTTRGAAAVSLGVDRKDIASRVSALRRGLRLPFRVVGGEEIASNDPRDLAAFDLDAAAALGDILVKPLKPHLSSVKKLVIVADGPLQSLPFGVLVEEKGDASLDGFERYKSAHYLIDRYAISVQPSVSAVRTLRAKTPRSKGDLAMLGFADPSLGGVKSGGAILSLGGIGDAKRLEDLPELPQTRSLLNTVGLALGARPEDLHYRDKAHEADFRAYDAVLPRYRMLTFATHGLVSDEIAALNLKEPALVLSLPPTVAGAARPAENDGLLLASDIVGFEMDADLVILAACNTAAADGTPGAEPLTGLAKAFMAKGARALLVSHWQADANASAALIPAMARNAETNGFAEGLAKAQRDLKNSAAYDPDPQSNTLHYAHPAIWGAFTLIGEPGR